MSQPLVLVVVGPTASGKSELAVKLAKKFDGEIISADSRQIYRGLDIGSGKVGGHWQKVFFERSEAKSRSSRQSQSRAVFRYKSITHYLIDEANPRVQYSVARFQKNAHARIAEILSRGKTPILCGGTGYWIDAVVFAQTLPEVKPNLKLRKQLEKLSVEQLFTKLQKLDPDRAAEIDAKNPRRLIRALEIVMSTGKPVPANSPPFQGGVAPPKAETGWSALWLGINPSQEILHKKIAKRLKERLRDGMIREVEHLHKSGLSWKRLESFGLEYKFIALFLQNKLAKTEMEKQLLTAIKQYAKRQMTWWKRNQNIHWSSKPAQLLALAHTPLL